MKELYWVHHASNEELAELFHKLGEEENISVMDSAEKKSIKRLQTLGVYAVPARKGSDSIHYGIKEMLKYKIHIHKHSSNLIDEFNSYKWKRMVNGEFVRNSFGHKVPIDRFNHGIDAVRYAVTYMTHE